MPEEDVAGDIPAIRPLQLFNEHSKSIDDFASYTNTVNTFAVNTEIELEACTSSYAATAFSIYDREMKSQPSFSTCIPS